MLTSVCSLNCIRKTKQANISHLCTVEFLLLFFQFLSDNVIEELVRPLLAILDRPEKLLLLREIR